MNCIQFFGVTALFLFYTIYLAKAYSLKKYNIQVNRLAKGQKDEEVRRLEIVLICVSYTMPLIQITSIFFIPTFNTNLNLQVLALIIAYVGIIFFASAVYVMRKNWRAGIDESQKTELVKTGIYKLSRNPAFVGFDLFYIGIGLCFANNFIILFCFLALIVFHKQILAEEKYLIRIFQDQYLNYKKITKRYIFF